MPRQARKKSALNIYHVMLRGINRQSVFDCDADKQYFMTILQKYKEVSGFRLHAFCLMTNHVHLLMEPAGEPLEVVFKRIGTSYAGWYNRKYQRTGHLFQDRFRSEIVDTDQYFMTVLRYILQNPTKAGMESCPGSYRWSSYLAYERGKGTVTDTQFALGMFGGHDALVEFVRQPNDDTVMDEADFDWRMRDDQARMIMEKVSQCSSASEFQQLDKPIRKAYIREMYLENLSIRQIADLTGVPKSTVHTAIQAIDYQMRNRNAEFLLREDATDYQTDDEVW